LVFYSSTIHTAVASGTGQERTQHSWVTIVTRLQAGWTAVWFPAKARDFCLLQNVQTGSGAHLGTRGCGMRLRNHLHLWLQLQMGCVSAHMQA